MTVHKRRRKSVFEIVLAWAAGLDEFSFRKCDSDIESVKEGNT